MPGKVQQLEQWPEPQEQSDLVSFLAFVNYLREFLDPEWTIYEQVFRVLRKKEAKREFAALWQSGQKVKIAGEVKFVTCKQAFEAIRAALRRDAVLSYPDYAAAQDPRNSGRPLEIFVDASDYGWAAVLCQREHPHGAPKIVSIVSKSFDPTQLRWSAMERNGA